MGGGGGQWSFCAFDAPRRARLDVPSLDRTNAWWDHRGRGDVACGAATQSRRQARRDRAFEIEIIKRCRRGHPPTRAAGVSGIGAAWRRRVTSRWQRVDECRVTPLVRETTRVPGPRPPTRDCSRHLSVADCTRYSYFFGTHLESFVASPIPRVGRCRPRRPTPRGALPSWRPMPFHTASGKRVLSAFRDKCRSRRCFCAPAGRHHASRQREDDVVGTLWARNLVSSRPMADRMPRGKGFWLLLFVEGTRN